MFAAKLEQSVDLKIDEARLLGRIRELSQIGADPRGGTTRPGFTEADRKGQRYIIEQAEQAKLTARVDEAGNLLLSRSHSPLAAPDRQVLLMGSHLDTVVRGGSLDGAYGVLAALDVLQILHEQDVELPYEPVVAAFANEEGALFPQPFWGSLALCGRLGQMANDPRSRDGESLRDQLALAGGDLNAIERARWPDGAIAAYLELHIEQGPVLENAGVPIGVVDAIVGRTVFEIVVRGTGGHAGTTPMDQRHDALIAAAHVVLGVQEIACERKTCRTATVGILETEAASANVIPALVRMTAEVRDSDSDRLAETERAVREMIDSVAEQTGTQVSVAAITRTEPVSTHPELRNLIGTAAEEAGVAPLTLPSGAGHDAQIMSAIAPVGMIFVPSRGGVSHVPAEDSAPEHLVLGAEVLLRTVLRTCGAASRTPVGKQ